MLDAAERASKEDAMEAMLDAAELASKVDEAASAATASEPEFVLWQGRLWGNYASTKELAGSSQSLTPCHRAEQVPLSTLTRA